MNSLNLSSNWSSITTNLYQTLLDAIELSWIVRSESCRFFSAVKRETKWNSIYKFNASTIFSLRVENAIFHFSWWFFFLPSTFHSHCRELHHFSLLPRVPLNICNSFDIFMALLWHHQQIFLLSPSTPRIFLNTPPSSSPYHRIFKWKEDSPCEKGNLEGIYHHPWLSVHGCSAFNLNLISWSVVVLYYIKHSWRLPRKKRAGRVSELEWAGGVNFYDFLTRLLLLLLLCVFVLRSRTRPWWWCDVFCAFLCPSNAAWEFHFPFWRERWDCGIFIYCVCHEWNLILNHISLPFSFCFVDSQPQKDYHRHPWQAKSITTKCSARINIYCCHTFHHRATTIASIRPTSRCQWIRPAAAMMRQIWTRRLSRLWIKTFSWMAKLTSSRRIRSPS